MMYKLLLFVCAVSFVTAEGETEEFSEKCLKLFHPRSAGCCKKRIIPPPDSIAEIKECFNLTGHHHRERRHMPFGPMSCEVETCIAQKKGILADDGTIDEHVLKKLFEKDLADYPDFMKKLTDNCVQSDKIQHFGTKEMCEPVKLKHCIMYHLITSCEEWFENPGCERVKSTMDECRIEI